MKYILLLYHYHKILLPCRKMMQSVLQVNLDRNNRLHKYLLPTYLRYGDLLVLQVPAIHQSPNRKYCGVIAHDTAKLS